MLTQATLLAFLVGIVCVCGTKLSVEDYLRRHPKLSSITDDLTDEFQQKTLWDRSLTPDRDLTYPVENYPVPEVKVQLFGERKQRKRPRARERRQITPESCYLLFGNRVHVIKMANVPSLRISIAMTGLNNTVAVDFDKRDGCIFWSDVALHQIYQLCGDGDKPTVLVDTNITTPDGIAWDWVNKKMYWTDMGDQDLEVYDPSTGHRKVLFKFEATSQPRAIVVDPSTGYMYWTDWGSPATINQASMDGSNHTVLHNTGLWWPNALTIDYDNQILYWVDAALDRLESSNTDGSGRIELSMDHIYHPFSITFLAGVLYWSDWDLNAILAASLSDLSAVNVIFGDLTLDPMGLTAACAERQANVSNPCDGRCNGKLCLLSCSKPQGYSCSCSSGESIARGKDEPVCEHSCGANGACAGHNYCSCSDGWRGVACDKGLCTEMCMYGDCTGPNTCSCDDGWEGYSCNQAVCCSECVHGTCTSPGRCSCQDGWDGALCDQQTCSVVGGCVNGGSCKASRCDCPSDYGGVWCEKICSIQDC